jgi:WhiB family redox-sensing transcriptional regulator
MYPVDVFYGPGVKPIKVREAALAKEICAYCPVARDCLIDALRCNESDGVRAGLAPVERKRLVKDNGGDWKAAIDAWEALRR